MINLNDKEFSEFIEKESSKFILFFEAAWCTKCKALKPFIDKLENDFHGELLFVSIDNDNNAKTSVKYDVRSLPTLVAIDERNVVDKIANIQSEIELITWLKKIQFIE